MGIMSDETRKRAEQSLDIICTGLTIAGPKDARMQAAVSVLRAYGMKAFQRGWDAWGLTDEVTVQADGDVTGSIQE